VGDVLVLRRWEDLDVLGIFVDELTDVDAGANAD
jgi:hypothetical protein